MPILDEVRAANAAYADEFAKGDLAMPPARKFAVLACMDARLDPAKALGLAEGDAHVIRNAGGRASDDAIRAQVRERLGADADGIDFLPFADVDQSERDDVAAIRDSPLVPASVTVAGAVYDDRTGRLRRVE